MFRTLISHVQKLKMITKHNTYNLHYKKKPGSSSTSADMSSTQYLDVFHMKSWWLFSPIMWTASINSENIF